MTKKIPNYLAQIKEEDDTGIFAVSFVKFPANERRFVAMSKARASVAMKLNKYEQILTGVVLIPNQQIYRDDPQMDGKPYSIEFDAQGIKKIAQKMMRDGVSLKNTTHQHETYLKGNYLVELWIVADSKRDKSVALGLGELPVGTLCASYKIEDAQYWKEEVLTGNVEGFSIEGYFNFNQVKMAKNTKPAGKLPQQKKKSTIGTFLKQVGAFLEGETVDDAEALVDEASKDEVDAGTPYIIFELADGTEVHVDADGNATRDGEVMPAGEHELADGNIIVIDADNMLVVTTDEASGAEAVASEVELAEARKRGKQFAKLSATSKDKKIANLQAQIAELKKTPSTGGKKKATLGANGKGQFSDTPHGKLAQVLHSKLN